MKKDFDRWNEVKKSVNDSDKYPLFQEREIWNCYLGKNIGHEENGKDGKFLRPVLIYRKFNQHIFWGIPLTTSEKSGKFYHELKTTSAVKDHLILSQIKLLDIHRLFYRMRKISEQEYQEIIKEVLSLHPRLL